jgi:hypothetical protein
MRGDMGMHYTSVPNIMKVLQPLFLLSLEEEFEAARNSESKLKKLLERIYKIRVFDPACGSGNFLIISYRELRKLETRIFQRLKEVATQWSLPMSSIRLNYFYGLELADFATETAKLSLWIAEYQMNEQFKLVFGSAPSALPLKDSGNIVQGNATRVDWLSVCPRRDDAEIISSEIRLIWAIVSKIKTKKTTCGQYLQKTLMHTRNLITSPAGFPRLRNIASRQEHHLHLWRLIQSAKVNKLTFFGHPFLSEIWRSDSRTFHSSGETTLRKMQA